MLIGPYRIESARVKTLFTTGLEIVGARPNFLIYPNFCYVYKAAGAYTIGAATGLVLKWTGVGGNILTSTLGFADASAASSTRMGMNASVGVILDDFQTFYNAGLTFSITGGNLSGDGGDLELTIDVTIFPERFTKILNIADEFQPDGYIR